MMNPMMQILQAVRNGADPLAFISQMAPRNPQAAQLVRMTQGKTPAQIETLARNLCKECGTTPEAVLQRFGISPSGMQ